MVKCLVYVVGFLTAGSFRPSANFVKKRRFGSLATEIISEILKRQGSFAEESRYPVKTD
jgi:hypothetical protein